MARLTIDFGKPGIQPVQLGVTPVKGDYEIFGSVFNGKILIGVKHETYLIEGVQHWKRMYIEIYQASNLTKVNTIQSIYPILPNVPESSSDPKNSLYSSYLKKLPTDPDKCIDDFRNDKFSSLVMTAENSQYDWYGISLTSPVENTNLTLGEWIKGNSLSPTNKGEYIYKRLSTVNGNCNSSTVTSYLDNRPSLNIPEENRSATEVVLALPFEL